MRWHLLRLLTLKLSHSAVPNNFLATYIRAMEDTHTKIKRKNRQVGGEDHRRKMPVVKKQRLLLVCS